ncbi:MAG: NTP transferase domain-containing protein [Bacteroidales bacterium]|nr:NTP transferase domain-containing protein [Bacteroidales bacterium]
MEQSEQKPETYTALILAAGYSGRMGKLKGFLPFDEKRIFLEKIVSEYLTFGCRQVGVVLNEQGMRLYEKMPLQHKNNITAILNPAPEKERFFSLQTGLKALKPAGAVFLHNVDSPFLKQEVLQYLADNFHKQAYVVPTYQDEGGHPVLLSQEIVKALTEAPDYDQNLRVFLQNFAQIKVPVNDPGILTNINSPEEYEQYFGKPYHKSL